MPGPRVIDQDNYEVALKLAQGKWRARDPETQARRCGAVCTGTGEEICVKLDFFSRGCEVTHPGGEVWFAGRAARPTVWEQILILHYLIAEGPVSGSEKLIAYSEVPDGKFYDAAFQKRTRNFLLCVFGPKPELFAQAAASAGAEMIEMGDVAYRLRAFPHVWLYLVLWRGDDEFPPDASILLEERIRSYLDAEDIAVLGGLAVSLVAKAAKK